MRPAEEEATSKTKTAVARGRTKATRSPKHVVDVSDFSTYTYKDPELALAYANVEVTPGAPEGEPERKPIEPMRWYITNADEAEDALTGLKGPVGFDMEWTVIFRRGVIPRKTALIQVADKTKIMLFHISRMSEFPRSLKRIIEDPTIVKTGVNITGDAKKLYGDWGIQAQGIVELAMLAWEVDKPTMQRHGFKTGWTTLANMVAMYTRRVLPKGAERTSDWEKPLNEEQLEYASNDAHCGLVIYNKLVAKAEEATIDLSKLRLNRMVEEGSEDTAPTENDGKAQEAEDAYAESVLASTSETQTQTEDQTEPEPQAASSSRARTSTRAPPCPSGVEYYRYRAYRMWYENPSLTLDEMCVRMRSAEQPLARTTVIGYVITTLECDTEKTLPFSKERLVALLREEPRSWQWNYKKITALGFTS
ncbi:hypothetical protein FRB90_001503 [Tulasnella sp. 427]|nr:hypothetical protein FRB90_001503 [Tulasnella sp. 427]